MRPADFLTVALLVLLLAVPRPAQTASARRRLVLGILTALAGTVVGVLAADLYSRSVSVAQPVLPYLLGAGLGGTFAIVMAARRARWAEQKRGWLQFRLRTLLVTTAVFAVFFAMWRDYLGPHRAEWQAMVMVQDLGGRVEKRLVGPIWLREVIGTRYLMGADVVDLRGTAITVHELENLSSMSHVQTLDLTGTAMTDAGVRHLRGMKRLRRLYLGSTRMTDTALSHLSELTELRVVLLENTEVTDAGLVHLMGLERLWYVDLSGCKVTKQGIDRLRQALPKCTIIASLGARTVVPLGGEPEK